MAHGLASINWQAPWLAPLAPVGQALAAQVLAGASCADALNNYTPPGGAPVHFVPQSLLPPGEAYERFIFDTRQCPTRNGLHDFFNGLVWHHLPLTKVRLNQLQAAQIALDGIGQVRGKVRDALTVFDENAAFLLGPPALWDALVAKDWPRLFVDLRPLWGQAQLVLFGHALMEKLVSPRKAMTAHVYRGPAAATSLAALDAWMAADLSADKLAAKPFAHLPVLGVPGWWAANEDLAFYDDVSVFRRPRIPLGPGEPVEPV
jgi:hypothetical protein